MIFSCIDQMNSKDLRLFFYMKNKNNILDFIHIRLIKSKSHASSSAIHYITTSAMLPCCPGAGSLRPVNGQKTRGVMGDSKKRANEPQKTRVGRLRLPRWWQLKYFLRSSLFGEMIHFDSYFSNGLKPPTSYIPSRELPSLKLCK